MSLDYASVPPRLGKRGPAPRPVSDRFWDKVLFGDGCWEWAGPFDSKGYGLMSFGSNANGSMRKMAAHRMAYEIRFGPVPRHLNCCHKCDNRRCVRPDHLFIGTQMENMHDMRRKGRGAPTVLSEKQVSEIRRKWTGSYGDNVRLAREYGVRPSVISHVVRRWSWKHLP